MTGNYKQYTKKNGTKAWMINSLYLGQDEYGKQVRVTRRGFPTLKAAKLKASELKIAFDNGEITKKAPDCSFQELYELWFESYRLTVKEATSITTERYVKNHVLPVF